MRSAAAPVVTSTVLLVALTACGGGDSNSTSLTSQPEASAGPSESSSSAAAPETPSEPPASSAPAEAAGPEAELEAAYRSYVDAFLTGDGATAYDLLSARCQEATPLSEFAGASEAAAELYGPVDYTIESVTVDGKRGKLDATYPVAALNQGGGSEWVLEDGAWRSDKCD